MQNGTYTLQIQSSHIGYSIVGNGAPLLICPVSWGIDGHRWTMLDKLAEDFTLIRLDPRGTGRSGEVQKNTEYGIPTLVEDIDALRSHLGVDRWNVMGQSAGGWTALEYSLAFQNHVDKLVVVCSAPSGIFHKNTFRDPIHRLYPEFKRISESIRSLPADERVKAFNRAIYQFDIQSSAAKKVVDRIFEHAEFNARRNNYFVMKELSRYDVSERLEEISLPSLIIGGIHDAHVSSSWSEFMAEKIPHAQLNLMQNSGHFPWLDEPKLFFEIVKNFFL